MNPTGRGAHPCGTNSINSCIMCRHFQVKTGIQGLPDSLDPSLRSLYERGEQINKLALSVTGRLPEIEDVRMFTTRPTRMKHKLTYL